MPFLGSQDSSASHFVKLWIINRVWIVVPFCNEIDKQNKTKRNKQIKNVCNDNCPFHAPFILLWLLPRIKHCCKMFQRKEKRKEKKKNSRLWLCHPDRAQCAMTIFLNGEQCLLRLLIKCTTIATSLSLHTIVVKHSQSVAWPKSACAPSAPAVPDT